MGRHIQIAATSNRRRGGGAAAAFSPTDIGGLFLWLKADDGPVYDPTTKAVTTWSDKSGADPPNDFKQDGPDSSKPTYETGEQGGLPSLSFDGGDYLYIDAPINEATQGDIFIVLERYTSDNILAAISTAKTSDTSHWFTTHASDGSGFLFKVAISSRVAGQGDVATSGTALTANTYYIVEWFSNGDAGGYGITINETDQTITMRAGLNTGDWWGDSEDRVNWTIGALKNNPTTPGSFFRGHMSEIIVYDTKLLPANRTSIQTYLNDKYSIF